MRSPMPFFCVLRASKPDAVQGVHRAQVSDALVEDHHACHAKPDRHDILHQTDLDLDVRRHASTARHNPPRPSASPQPTQCHASHIRATPGTQSDAAHDLADGARWHRRRKTVSADGARRRKTAQDGARRRRRRRWRKRRTTQPATHSARTALV